MSIIASVCDYEMWDYEFPPVSKEELLARIHGKRGVLIDATEKVGNEFLEAAGHQLRVVANLASGYDNIDVEVCTRRGVVVTNTPGVLEETAADLVWALLLAIARRIVEGQKLIERGEWAGWWPMFMTGQDVHEATIGIIGMGRIGTAVARRAKGFNMRILYHNRRRHADLEKITGAEYHGLDDILKESDFVICLLPLTEQTRGLFGAREFGLMKDTAYLINVGRGAVVNETALYEALSSGTIRGAALDVFEREPAGPDHPLLKLPNCICVPHIGSASVATRTRMAMLAAENLTAGVTGRTPPNPVNPEVLDFWN